jgi:hypothetical protein
MIYAKNGTEALEARYDVISPSVLAPYESEAAVCA